LTTRSEDQKAKKTKSVETRPSGKFRRNFLEREKGFSLKRIRRKLAPWPIFAVFSFLVSPSDLLILL
jgi:hypothetical protein